MNDNPRATAGATPASAVAPLTLYARRGCHLCQEMAQLLDEFSGRYAYTVSTVDIDRDPALKAKFNVLVPALYLGDLEICHHFLDLASLQAALQDFSQSIPANRVE